MKNLPDVSSMLQGLTTTVPLGLPGTNTPDGYLAPLWEGPGDNTTPDAEPPRAGNRVERRARAKWERAQHAKTRARQQGLRTKWTPFVGQEGLWLFNAPATTSPLPSETPGAPPIPGFTDVGHLARLERIVPDPDGFAALFSVATSESARAYLDDPKAGTWHYERPFRLRVTLDRLGRLLAADELTALQEEAATPPVPAAEALDWATALHHATVLQDAGMPSPLAPRAAPAEPVNWDRALVDGTAPRDATADAPPVVPAPPPAPPTEIPE